MMNTPSSLYEALPRRIREHMDTLSSMEERTAYLEQELLKMVGHPAGDYVLQTKMTKGERTFAVKKVSQPSHKKRQR